MRHLIITLSLLLITPLTSACGYLDQELHLAEEDYMATFGSEGLGSSGTGYSRGCGGVLRSSSRHNSGRRAYGIGTIGEAALAAPHEEAGNAVSLAVGNPLLVPLKRLPDEEEEREETPHLARDHELVTRIAARHAH